jgi:hypothetical protein
VLKHIHEQIDACRTAAYKILEVRLDEEKKHKEQQENKEKQEQTQAKNQYLVNNVSLEPVSQMQAPRGMQCGASARAFPRKPHARWVHEHVEAEAAAQEAAAAAQAAAAQGSETTLFTWRLDVTVRTNVADGPPGTWERGEVMQLRRALQNWDLYDANEQARVEEQLWRKFNSIMRPVGPLAHLWADVRWMELNVTDDEFEAESQDQRFLVTFDTMMAHLDHTVSITYSGPVRFVWQPGMLNSGGPEILDL